MPVAATRTVSGFITNLSAEQIAEATLRLNPDPDFILVGDTVIIGEQTGALLGEQVVPIAPDGAVTFDLIGVDSPTWTITCTVSGPNVEAPNPTFKIIPPPATGSGGVGLGTLFVDSGGGGPVIGLNAIRSATDYDNAVAPTDGQSIVWNATTGKFHPATITGGSGGSPDPAVWQAKSEKGQPNGYPGLDSEGALSVTNKVIRVGPVSYAYDADIGGGGTNSAYFMVDKANTASDASVLFRDQGPIRAELGLVGDNNVHLKTVSGGSGAEVFTDRIIVQTTGETWFPNNPKVGIGTIPVELLHIAQDNAAGRVTAKIENIHAGNNGAQIEFKGGTGDWVAGIDEGLNGNNNFFIADATNGTRAFIDGTGNMGIGTDAPGAKMDVRGTGAFTGTVTVATPTATGHAATKAYVDALSTTIAGKVDTTTLGVANGVGTLDGSGHEQLVQLAPGTTLTVFEASGTYPDRPTTRTDVSVNWVGADPPLIGGTKAMNGVDSWDPL